MTEVKHTPGPWVLEIGDKSGLAVVRGPMTGDRARTSDGTGEIAEINLAADGQFDAPMFPNQRWDMRANARLIAASPDLLEAVHGLLARYTRLVESGDAGHWDCETEVEVIAARAALEKATP